MIPISKVIYIFFRSLSRLILTNTMPTEIVPSPTSSPVMKQAKMDASNIGDSAVSGKNREKKMGLRYYMNIKNKFSAARLLSFFQSYT